MDYMNNPTEREQRIAREAAEKVWHIFHPQKRPDIEAVILAAIQDAKQQGRRALLRSVLQRVLRELTMNKAFWNKVAVGSPDSCWIWQGSRLKKNGVLTYGDFKPGGEKKMLAHRFAYQEHYGSIPKGLFVCHRCNNPACVNPSHLYPSDNAGNIRDAYRDGLLVNQNTRKPNCPKCGSEYLSNPDGRRRCRKCRTANQKAKRAIERASP